MKKDIDRKKTGKQTEKNRGREMVTVCPRYLGSFYIVPYYIKLGQDLLDILYDQPDIR